MDRSRFVPKFAVTGGLAATSILSWVLIGAERANLIVNYGIGTANSMGKLPWIIAAGAVGYGVKAFGAPLLKQRTSHGDSLSAKCTDFGRIQKAIKALATKHPEFGNHINALSVQLGQLLDTKSALEKFLAENRDATGALGNDVHSLVNKTYDSACAEIVYVVNMGAATLGAQHDDEKFTAALSKATTGINNLMTRVSNLHVVIIESVSGTSDDPSRQIQALTDGLSEVLSERKF